MQGARVLAQEVIEVFLLDPSPNVEVAVRNHILHLAKASPGDLFGLRRELVGTWKKRDFRWPGESQLRTQILEMMSNVIKGERLCHMCEMSCFAHVNTIGEGNMAVRHLRCKNDACGCWQAESA